MARPAPARSKKRSHHARARALSCLLAVLAATAATPPAAASLAPLDGITRVATGGSHACALTTTGGVKCWGGNGSGQLGDGSTSNSHLPVQVEGLDSGVIDISAGFRHSCAVTAAGGVKCWGQNLLGQLGNDSTSNRSTPVDVSGLSSGVARVSAGGNHTCALDSDGELRCWGFNGDGQLGNGNTTRQPTPVGVIGGQNIQAITTGYSHTCAITGSGGVSCWGAYDRSCNSFGCSIAGHALPTPVAGLGTGVEAISAGEYFNCALMDTGGVKCWGDNYDGQLGDLGTPDPDPFTLHDIEGLASGVVEVSAGNDHACARLANGSLRCWGENGPGQLGDGTSTDRYPPVAVSGLGNAAQIAAGGSFSCARTSGGGVMCWGSNASGQLGDNDPWFRDRPVPLPQLASGVQAIAVGDFHSCAITATGAVRCWGGNSSGQVGDGSFIDRATPVAVAALGTGVRALGTGAAHSCAVTSTGAARCWGAGEHGQLGNDAFDDQPTPVAVEQLDSGVAGIDAGDFHSCARTASGAVKCWGRNIESQLGGGGLGTSPTPIPTFNLAAGAGAISTGGYHSCALVDGAIHCWGANSDGPIGDGSTDTAFIPEVLAYPSQGVSRISAGNAHTCAIASGGEALCWGDNDEGRLGLGFNFGRQTTPIRVQGLASGVADISAGQMHSCAAMASGAALCWGNNATGQLGDGSTDRRTSPTPVSGLGTGVVQVAAGAFHSCALDSAGAVSCWGYNVNGQLGIGRREHRLPSAVLDDPTLFGDGFE